MRGLAKGGQASRWFIFVDRDRDEHMISGFRSLSTSFIKLKTGEDEIRQ